MLFAAVIEYTKDAQRIAEARPRHREYLAGLLRAGNLLAAGPFADDHGALIIYHADTLERAEELIRNDPFHAAGVFVRYELRPWKAVMASRELLPDGIPGR
jgi:uncharacterized protein YciI